MVWSGHVCGVFAQSWSSAFRRRVGAGGTARWGYRALPALLRIRASSEVRIVKEGPRQHTPSGMKLTFLLIVIPTHTPHWFKEVRGPFLYYVVKVTQ